MIIIKKANKNQLNEVRNFYHSLIDDMEKRGLIVTWIKDVYPSTNLLKSSIDKDELYVCYNDESLVSAMILNHNYNDEYKEIQWDEKLTDQEILVIHALGVHPCVIGRGIGKKMVYEAINIAKNFSLKAIRLDVLKSNKPAKKLYLSCGFKYCGTLPLFYENTGEQDFEMFELLL